MLTGALSLLDANLSRATVDLLCFDIGNERFAVELSSVDEVVDAAILDAHTLNGSMIGVLRLRDGLLPVHDAQRVLSVARTSAQPMALMFTLSGESIAVLVDSAEAALGVNIDSLRAPGAIVARDNVLKGALKVGKHWVGLLDATALIESFRNIALLEEPRAH